MKYKARLVSIEPADPGYAYPTYEYTDQNGQIRQVTGQDGVIINPWDFQKTHTIKVNENGELDSSSWSGLLWALGIMAAFFAIGIGGPMISERFFGLIFIAVSFIPLVVFGRQSHRTSKRRRNARHTDIQEGKIVWYHEVRKRTKHGSHTYHYPVVQYNYAGQTFSAILYEDEEPVHEGETREFYIDFQEEDIYTPNQCKNFLAGLRILFTFCFTLPFLFAGIAIAFPEIMEAIYDMIFNNVKPGTSINMNALGQYLPFVFIGIFSCVLIGTGLREFFKLLPMLKAKNARNTVYAAYTKTVDYGRTHVQMYEYTYMGQTRRYQVQSYRNSQSLELFVNPDTGKAYSQMDITKQFVKIGIMAFMTVMVLLMMLPFKEAFTNW